MNRRLIFNLTGAVLLVESAMMMISFVLSLALHSGDHWPLLLSAGITLAFGGGFRLIHPATDYLRARDGFAVVLWDDQLTVLSRTEEGYHLDYTCPTQTAYVTGYTVSFTDPEPEKQGDEDAMPYTVAPNFAMAYQDGKLAVAAYIGNGMSYVLLLEVYGPEGLLYATARVPSVERQFAADNVRSMWVREDKKAPFPEADISTPIPELTWEK